MKGIDWLAKAPALQAVDGFKDIAVLEAHFHAQFFGGQVQGLAESALFDFAGLYFIFINL